MRAQRSSHVARQACLRCRKHKRRCDRIQPQCSLCKRLGVPPSVQEHQCCLKLSLIISSLHQVCRYENATSSVSQRLEIKNVLTPQGIKLAILQELIGLEPEVIVSIYRRTIYPWFAFISGENLSQRLPQAWADATVDVVLLAFILVLFDESPQRSGQYCGLPPDTVSRYLSSKSWIALLEGAGLNSPDFLNARLLITLFEMVHGVYPAACLSIVATIQAAHILFVCDGQQGLLSRSSISSEGGFEEHFEALWRCIVILDR